MSHLKSLYYTVSRKNKQLRLISQRRHMRPHAPHAVFGSRTCIQHKQTNMQLLNASNYAHLLFTPPRRGYIFVSHPVRKNINFCYLVKLWRKFPRPPKNKNVWPRVHAHTESTRTAAGVMPTWELRAPRWRAHREPERKPPKTRELVSDFSRIRDTLKKIVYLFYIKYVYLKMYVLILSVFLPLLWDLTVSKAMHHCHPPCTPLQLLFFSSNYLIIWAVLYKWQQSCFSFLKKTLL